MIVRRRRDYTHEEREDEGEVFTTYPLSIRLSYRQLQPWWIVDKSFDPAFKGRTTKQLPPRLLETLIYLSAPRLTLLVPYVSTDYLCLQFKSSLFYHGTEEHVVPLQSLKTCLLCVRQAELCLSLKTITTRRRWLRRAFRSSRMTQWAFGGSLFLTYNALLQGT